MSRSGVYWNYKIRSHPLNKIRAFFLMKYFNGYDMNQFKTHVAESIESNRAYPMGCREFAPQRISSGQASLASSGSQGQYKDTSPDTER